MLLAVDIGNSSIKLGVFENAKLVAKIDLPTNGTHLKGSIDALLQSYFVSHAIVSSVVPSINEQLRTVLRTRFGVTPQFVNSESGDFELIVSYNPPSSLGTDRLINASAAAEKYDTPIIVCSLGTATTLDAVDTQRRFLGGIIAPGVRLLSKALGQNTALLPQISISEPAISLLGNTTEDSIKSGIFYGHAAMIDGLVTRVRERMGTRAQVVATGGFASLICGAAKSIDIVDENLTLDGLQMYFARRTTQ